MQQGFGISRRLKSWLALICLPLAALSASSCRGETVGTGPSALQDRTLPPSPEPAAGRPVDVEMKRVNFRMDEGITLGIRTLNGRLISRTKGPVVFDDKQSFALEIDRGEIAIDTTSLTNLLNQYVFAYRGSPLKNLTISTEGSQLKQKGTLHKGIDIPFTIVADITATPEGRIRLHPTSIKAAGIPSQGLMKFFGLELEELLKVRPERGIEIDGDDMIMYPDRMLPPPTVRGRIARVFVRGDDIVQVFSSDRQPKKLPPTESPIPNYMYFNGGLLRFGKLMMTDADLEIVDARPEDWFDFYLDQYNAQLVAGYSKNTPDHGLITHMPDFHRLARSTRLSQSGPAGNRSRSQP